MDATDILLVTPPFVQLNTPYPATVFLKGFLKPRGFEAAQCDLSLETALRLFSRKGLAEVFAAARSSRAEVSPGVRRILDCEREYLACVEPVIAFLQGKDQAFAHAVCGGALPGGPRWETIPDLDAYFGPMGLLDRAKYLATLFLEELGDLITELVDPRFGFSRYAESLSLKVVRFADLRAELEAAETVVGRFMCQLLDARLRLLRPRALGLTVPFPGNFFAALKLARHVKLNYPQIPVILGGGYVNTELRSLSEPALFDYVDYVCLDDGERPLLQLLDHLLRGGERDDLVRTFMREDGAARFVDNGQLRDFPHAEIGAPDYGGLPLDSYVSVLERVNPMQRLWSDGRWNKLALAHGCYWHKCAFCDVSLDYIKRYSQTSAAVLCDRVEAVVAQTGQSGFHFVDEAAPPALLRDLALELLRRNVRISWWANIRFEEAFTADLCQLLAQAGCVAVAGGLEVASDRLLKVMDKGVNLEQAIQAAGNLSSAGIMVHAYLMYGFPTQTAQETVDALELVRQMFVAGLSRSAFWHRFAMTEHSLVGQDPAKYHASKVASPPDSFARNGVEHLDPEGCDHGRFSFGLKKALYNYMNGDCLDFELQEWFDFKIPRVRVPRDFVLKVSRRERRVAAKAQVVWLGAAPELSETKRGKVSLRLELRQASLELELPEAEGRWLAGALGRLAAGDTLTFEELAASYVGGRDFAVFCKGEDFQCLRENGLLFL